MKKKWFYLLAFFVFIAVIITYPAILTMNFKMIGDMGDGYQFIGFQYLAKKLFFSGQFPFGWTSFWRYPYGIQFQNVYDSSLLVILGLFFYQLTSNPILVYNLSIISFIVLGLGLTYYSFRSFFNTNVSLIGSVIYGLTFSSIARLGGHINLFLIPSFLFFFTSLYQIYKYKGSKKSFIIFTLASILIPFSSLQFPLLLIGSLPFISLLTWFFYKIEIKEFFHVLWQKKNYIFFSLLMIISIFGLFHGQKLLAVIRHEVQLPVNEITSIPIVNYIFPNSYLKTFSATIVNDSKEWIEYVTFFGYIEIILFLIALVKLKFTKNELFFFFLFIIFFILSLGKQEYLKPIWPYQYLFPIFPYRGIIEPGRFAAFSLICSTTLILLFLSKINNKKILIALLVLLIVERLPLNFQMSPNMYNKNFINTLKNAPSRAILHLPLYVDWWNGQYYDMYSVYSDKPMANGYIQWSGNTPESQTLTKYLEEYTCYFEPQYAPRDFDLNLAQEKKQFILKTLVQYDIQTIVLNKDLYLDKDNCFRARQYINILLEDKERWQTLYDDGKKEIKYLLKN